MHIFAISDIHLETRQEIPEVFVNWDESGDVLILAGDIGCPFKKITEEFLTIMSPFFKVIYYVSGNHEYYSGKQMKHCDEKMEKLCKKFSNVVYLNNKTTEFNGVKFIGSPLWSYIPDGDHFPNTGDAMNINGMTQKVKNKLYFENVHFLTSEIEKARIAEECVVVITHHLPSYRLVAPQHKNYPRNFYYASHLDHLFEGCSLWIHGHSHTHLNTNIDGCIIYRNPVGYYDEKWVFENEYFEL